MKNIFSKIDPTKAFSIAATVLGLAETLISVVVDNNNRNTMKQEIKAEVLKELSNEKN